MGNHVKLEAVCENYFGMSTRRYRQLATEGLFPPPINGSIDFAKAAKAVIAYYKQMAAGQGSITLTDQRARLTKINADRKQLMLERERGELISTEKAMHLWGGVCLQIRSKILSVPSKVPLIFSCKSLSEAKDALEKLLWEVLTEIANPNLKSIPDKNKEIHNAKKNKLRTTKVR